VSLLYKYRIIFGLTCCTLRTDCCCYRTRGRSMNRRRYLHNHQFPVCSILLQSRSWSDCTGRICWKINVKIFNWNARDPSFRLQQHLYFQFSVRFVFIWMLYFGCVLFATKVLSVIGPLVVQWLRLVFLLDVWHPIVCTVDYFESSSRHQGIFIFEWEPPDDEQLKVESSSFYCQ